MAATPVAAIVVFMVLVAGVGRTTTSGSAEWPDYYEIERLIEDSHLIVVARFIGEERERVEIPSPVMENSGVYRDDVLREYEAETILLGTLDPGERLVVWNSEGIADPGGMRGMDYALAEAIAGEQYVLFLRHSMREEQPVWGRTGEPEKALVDGDTLRFIASSRYVETAMVHGHSFPQEGSQAPFVVTLDELQVLVAELFTDNS